MHPVVIILLILTVAFSVQARRWLDQVERGIVSYFKYLVTIFLLLIMILHLLWRYSFEPVTIMCYGMFGGLILIDIINIKTNGSEKSKDDLRIWSGHTTLLMFGTGALTLIIHAPNSIKDVTPLLGFVGMVFYYMFLRVPR